MNRFRLRLDERNIRTVQRLQATAQTVMTVLLIAVFLRRLHVLEQTFAENWDIGALIMLNGAFLLGGILLRGGIDLPPIRPKWVIAAFFLFLLSVLLLKTSIAVITRDPDFSVRSLLSGDLLVIMTVCAVITVVFAGIAYLGQRDMDKRSR
ncbi:MAG: hypothetical protein GY838_15285 [bacterium]|nr:hypothetical protein [bacterium]